MALKNLALQQGPVAVAATSTSRRNGTAGDKKVPPVAPMTPAVSRAMRLKKNLDTTRQRLASRSSSPRRFASQSMRQQRTVSLLDIDIDIDDGDEQGAAASGRKKIVPSAA